MRVGNGAFGGSAVENCDGSVEGEDLQPVVSSVVVG